VTIWAHASLFGHFSGFFCHPFQGAQTGSQSDQGGANLAGVSNAEPTSDDYTAAIAAELKAERAATGVQNARIAEVSGLSTRQLVRIFKGERSVGVSDLILICQSLGIDLSTLIARAEARIEKQRQA
jgi:AraC-like DNA-binding protein